MDFSTKFDNVQDGPFYIIVYCGVIDCNFQNCCICYIEFVTANSADPDEIPRSMVYMINSGIMHDKLRLRGTCNTTKFLATLHYA